MKNSFIIWWVNNVSKAIVCFKGLLCETTDGGTHYPFAGYPIAGSIYSLPGYPNGGFNYQFPPFYGGVRS